MFGGITVRFDPSVMRLSPRSDRKTYRGARPKYGSRRKRPAKVSLCSFQTRAFRWRGRRCAPRLIAKPAMFMLGSTLIAHPAMRPEIERLLSR